MPLYAKVSGEWKQSSSIQVKVTSEWKPVQQVYNKVEGIWKPSFAYEFSVGSYGGCSVSCGGGAQTRPVSCLKDGVVVDNGYCNRAGLSTPNNSQACNTHSCTECRFNISTDYMFINPRSTYFSTLVWGGVRITTGSSLVQNLNYSGGGYYYYTNGVGAEGSESTEHPSGGSYTTYYYRVCRRPI